LEKSFDIAVVGAGMVGLAHAYMAAKRGYKVVVFEREQFAVGASVRNFGLLWPIGQAPGIGLDRALRSRQHWQEIAARANIWLKPNGSFHLAYHADEVEVLNEFMELYQGELYEMDWHSADEIVERSPGVKRQGLLGGLYSKTECTVYSRQAIRQIPEWLREKYGVVFHFGKAISSIHEGVVCSGSEQWRTDHVFICSGSDFETLYPEWFDKQEMTKCKLQMMKAISDHPIDLGPSLCAGLTLRHYDAFKKCTSLEAVSQRYDQESLAFRQNGVHVLVSQNTAGEFIIGDSHHYSKTVEPFDAEEVNQLILSYLSTFFQTEKLTITERWHGVYPKYAGGIDLILKPERNVTIVNGLGGAGMTLSFGLAEDVINSL
jgi:D-hydroxyproline dehydrogenase subunit beta